jgi:hypothetical protein
MKAEKIIEWSLVSVITVIVVLCVWWLMWKLWGWVLPQLWADGPTALIHPSYWLFAAGWFLLSLVGRALFGRSKS